MNARRIALTAVSIAIVTVLVASVPVPIPATGGFTHPGAVAEIFVAVAFGPIVGMVAAGVGAALADLILGYGSWAPLTLIAHGSLGLLAGWLGQKMVGRLEIVRWYMYVVGLAAFAIAVSAMLHAAGEAATSDAQFIGEENYLLFGGVILLVSVVALGFGGILEKSVSVEDRPPVESRVGGMFAGWIVGGLALVALYFIGQATVYGLGVAGAVVELPINLFQVSLGVLGVGLYFLVRAVYPQIDQLAGDKGFTDVSED
ncbi:MAG: ECF transporter S component [Gammaproteobacteria bacterium]|nr:ECF transporter S component [Gammaproteobacteria bacterium]